jgi:hypothetical protein
VGRRSAEAPVELDEGGEGRAAESVDRLVVVPDDHDVVGAIGRPTQELDELDLRDARVLELVDQDGAELALVEEIARLIGRPPTTGGIGEVAAAGVGIGIATSVRHSLNLEQVGVGDHPDPSRLRGNRESVAHRRLLSF